MLMDARSNDGPRDRKAPQSNRQLSTRELIILLEGSKLNGSKFPPWIDGCEVTEFADTEYYEDDACFSFSESQLQEFAGWKTCASLQARSHAVASNLPAEAPVHDLVQDMTTDCSVVASLCALTSRNERRFPDLCSGMYFPWDHSHQRPGLSESGKYVFRFYFNGTYRKVVIDNRLPVSKGSRKYFVTDRNAPARLWPALLEKAYLKLRGGYDFSGSNSGTDLSVLTGWLPEQIFLQRLLTMKTSDDLDHEALWRRLFVSFRFGDVLITISTGTIAAEEEKGSGLAAQHDYAVIAMKEEGDQRNVLVKNPWSKDANILNNLSEIKVVGTEQDHSGISGQSHVEPGYNVETSSEFPGVFWMTFDKCFHSFESLHLNWNPCLFKYRQDIHFTWDLSKSIASNRCFRTNPQLSLHAPAAGVVWLLLSRHFSTRDERRQPRDLLDEGFISLYAFRSASRVVTTDGAIKNSQYVDSPNSLLKLEWTDKDPLVLVISEQSLPRARHVFSLSCFSFAPAELGFANDKYMHKQFLSSKWTKANGGGNSSSSVYYRNPQFSVDLSESGDLCVILESSVDHVPMHVALFWGNGERIRAASTRDIVGDTGEYTSGFTSAEIKDVAPGKYTAVCSTFEPGQIAAFGLHISATSDLLVKALPPLDAGQFINRTTSMPFGPNVGSMKLPLHSSRLNEISVAVHPCVAEGTVNRKPASPMRISITCGTGPMAHVLASSGAGDFSDLNPSGIHVERTTLSPEDCLLRGVALTVERLTGSSSGVEEGVEVCINSQDRLAVGKWTQDPS